MAELIDAGAQGQLTEELFERCLTVNDAIHRTLEAEKVHFLSLAKRQILVFLHS